MKRFAVLLVLISASFAGIEAQAPKAPDPPIVPGKFFTGAKPTPPAQIAEAIRTGKATIHRKIAAPASVIYVPKRLSYWGNNQYGDCVTAESVFSMAAYSTYIGLPKQIFITDSATIAWARSHGWLEGAFLLDVIQDMQKDGIKDEDGILRKAGTPSAVNYNDEGTLKSAIAQGPVSIAINASALPSGAGNKSGWYVFGGGGHGSNHDVSIFGYGATADLFKALNVTAPSNAPAIGYYVYTWSTIGVTDYRWVANTVEEAWVRNPTVTDLTPTPPPPPPPPATITVIVPPAFGNPGTPVTVTPTATGGTSPYLFLFDHGDGTNDASMVHTYQKAGSYTVTVTALDSLGRLGSGTCVATIGSTPPPPSPPTPGGKDTITWTINGVTSQYELMPVGTRQKVLEIFGPTAP
jgi:PKD repeat protein